MDIKKVERNGKIAVLVSPGFGAGWSTFNDDEIAKVLLYHPEIVRLVKENRRDEITEKYCQKLIGTDKHIYTGGAEQLEIKWIDKGTSFEITDYDGFESIHIIGEREYNVA